MSMQLTDLQPAQPGLLMVPPTHLSHSAGSEGEKMLHIQHSETCTSNNSRKKKSSRHTRNLLLSAACLATVQSKT